MALETMDAIPAVKAKLALIQEVQTEAFWKDITLPMIESVRRGLRDLVKFIERKAVGPIYTVLTDQKGEAKEVRSEEHTSELQSLMRISYAVFCLKKQPPHTHIHTT